MRAILQLLQASTLRARASLCTQPVGSRQSAEAAKACAYMRAIMANEVLHKKALINWQKNHVHSPHSRILRLVWINGNWQSSQQPKSLANEHLECLLQTLETLQLMHAVQRARKGSRSM